MNYPYHSQSLLPNGLLQIHGRTIFIVCGAHWFEIYCDFLLALYVKLIIVDSVNENFPFLPTASPRFTNPDKMKKQKIIRPVNSSLRLRCKATGNPRPQITWMKDEHNLYHGDLGRRSSWTLRLPDLQQTDSGHYTCVVWNRLGSINFTYDIQVIGKHWGGSVSEGGGVGGKPQ